MTNTGRYHSDGGSLPGADTVFRRWIRIGTSVSALVFAILLLIRIGFFDPPAPPPPTFDRTDALTAPRESWYAIYRDQRHIGYTHRLWRPTGAGFSSTESTVLAITAMGMSQRLRLYSTSILKPDLQLSKFQFRIASRQFHFKAEGSVDESTLRIRLGDNQETRVALDGPIYIMSGLMPAVAAQSLSPGESVAVPVFDPAIVSSSPIQVTFLGGARLPDSTDSSQYRHFRVRYNKMDYDAWVDDSGELVREAGALGMTLVRTTEAAATALKEGASPVDLTEWAAVQPNRPIPSPTTHRQLTLRLTGLPDGITVDGGRQHRNGSLLTITREPDRGSAESDDALPDEKMRSSSLLVQADHPEIQAAANALIQENNPMATARAIVSWVYQGVRKTPVLSVPDALTTLRNKAGDCNEHAVLVAALGRAAGIPTRIEAGLTYTRGRFFYHAWNAFHIDGWVTADAVFNQMPADVTHLRLVIGDPDRHVDLLPAIGQLRIDVETFTP